MLNPVHTSNNVEATFVKCYKVECCFDKVERFVDIVAGVDRALKLEDGL